MAEEMLDALPAWNEVPDLIMEIKDGRMMPEAAKKRKIDEEARGQRKRRREDDILPEKQEHSPTVSCRTRNPAGFYSEDWDELQQEEDEWQKILQMVFCDRGLEINPNEAGCISSSCTQASAWLGEREDKISVENRPQPCQG